MKNYPLNSFTYYSRFRDMICDLAAQNGDKPAISWYTRKQEELGVTYSQLCADVQNLQAKITDLGLAGKHLAIVGENSYEWLLVYFAAAYCGSTAVCVDIEQPDDTILQMLEMTDVDAVFLTSAHRELCSRYAGEDKPVYLLNGRADGVTTLAELMEAGAKLRESRAEDLSDDSVRPESVASIVFTSGTTNFSKPVMLSQKAILTNAADAGANVLLGDRVFTSLPFYHTYGLTCSVVAALVQGVHLYINGNMKTVMRDLQLSRADTLMTVPLMLETIHNRLWATAEQSGQADALSKLFKLKKLMFSLGLKNSGKTLTALREKALGSIRLIICGGAHLNPEISREFQYMGINVLQGYGITECAPLVSVNRNHANKHESVGLVSPHSEVKIVDGEILVRGDNVMTGYYGHKELTEETLVDGWFCTGDVGYLDKDGFLYITGRKKNLIVLKNGKKVSPEKLEEKIKKIPLVQDVMVYGAVSGSSADDVQIAASIYPDPEKTEGMASYEILERLQQPINQLNNTLPIYQQIQMVTIREQEFSKTALQKIKRHMN